MSLKIVLPFSVLAFGSSATATAGIYSHTSGSGKGPNRDGAGNGKVLRTPDNHNPGNNNPTNQRNTSVPSGAPEKKQEQQTGQTPTVDEASPKETPDSGQSNPSTEPTVEKTPTLEGGDAEGRGEDRGKKGGTSDSSTVDALPKDGTGENEKQSGDPKRTEGLERSSDQGAQGRVEQQTDNGNPKAAGDNADQPPQTDGGQEERTGHQDDSNKGQGVDVSGGSVGGASAPSGTGSDSKGTPPSTSNPTS